MDEKTRQQVSEAIADHDAAHPHWRQERRDREIREAQEAEARARRAHEGRRQTDRQVAVNNTQAWWVDERIVATVKADRESWRESWIDAMGKVVSNERAARRREIKAAVDEVKQWVSAKFEALERRIEQRLERHTEQCNHGIVVSAGRAETLGKMIETERADRQNEVKAAVEEVQRAVEAKLATLEQRVFQLANQRIAGRDGKDADPEAVARFVGERIEGPLREFIRAEIETKLMMLEERLKKPGKLPVVKVWQHESVTYQSEFVSHKGELFQAKRDTATTPGGDDWVCVARAGHDAITPNIRGTYRTDEKYHALDIVAMEGGSFVATRDAPGICPGPGWQLLCRQGRRGQKGETGARGLSGDKGEKGDASPSLVSWQVDRARYRASPLWSDGTVGPNLELHGLYEQYQTDTGNGDQ